MQHKTGTSRNQIQFTSLDCRISPDNPVRVIDAFVESLFLKEMGFKHTVVKSEGRPPYCPSMLLKLYLYGYNGGVRIRSSRRLEVECKRNGVDVVDRGDDSNPYDYCNFQKYSQ